MIHGTPRDVNSLSWVPSAARPSRTARRMLFSFMGRPSPHAASARRTASGSCSTILSRTRAERSGVRRPISHSFTASGAKPNRLANSTRVSASRLRMARTFTSSGTCTTKPLSVSPRAKARAFRTLARIRLPAFDMSDHSFAIFTREMGKLLAQLVDLRLAQVDAISLLEDVEQEHRQVPRSVASPRIVGDMVDDGSAFAVRYSGRPGITEIVRRLDDRLHRKKSGIATLPRQADEVALPLSLPDGRAPRHPEPSRKNADDGLALASPGRVQGGDGIVEGRDVADVRPQSSVPHPLDDLVQLGAIALDDEVDRQAVVGSRHRR